MLGGVAPFGGGAVFLLLLGSAWFGSAWLGEAWARGFTRGDMTEMQKGPLAAGRFCILVIRALLASAACGVAEIDTLRLNPSAVAIVVRIRKGVCPLKRRRRKRKTGLAMGWALLLLAGGLSLVGPTGLIARAAAQGADEPEGALDVGGGGQPALVGSNDGPPASGEPRPLTAPARPKPSRGRDDQVVGRGVRPPWAQLADWVVSFGHLSPQEADEILRQIWGWAQFYGRDPWLDVAVITVESVWNPSVESHMGARGLYQIMPATGDWLAEALQLPGYTTASLFEPKTSIYLGSYYLHQKYLQHGGDWHRALTAYNRGDGGLAQWVQANGTPETAYSQRVLELWAELKEQYGN